MYLLKLLLSSLELSKGKNQVHSTSIFKHRITFKTIDTYGSFVIKEVAESKESDDFLTLINSLKSTPVPRTPSSLATAHLGLGSCFRVAVMLHSYKDSWGGSTPGL